MKGLMEDGGSKDICWQFTDIELTSLVTIDRYYQELISRMILLTIHLELPALGIVAKP